MDQMRLEVKIGFRGDFGVKQSQIPRNTVLALRADQTHLFASNTSKLASRKTLLGDIFTWYGVRFFETRRDDHRLYLCHLPEGTSDLLGGPKLVFRGLFVTPKMNLNPYETSMTSCLTFVLFLRHSLS